MGHKAHWKGIDEFYKPLYWYSQKGCAEKMEKFIFSIYERWKGTLTWKNELCGSLERYWKI